MKPTPIVVIGISVLVAACAHTPPAPQAPHLGSAAADIARSMIGVPYVYGGESPKGFDCSGLAQYSFARAGLAIPRDSRSQRRTAKRIDLGQARPGDLLFFDTEWNRHHVGIYIGANRFVHAPSRGRHVTIDSLDDTYYRRRLVSVGRFGG